MTPIQALLLGIVEGLTEFLPISSTAHLIITSKLLAIPQNNFTTFFEIFIQSGAIVAVCILYAKYIVDHISLIPRLLVSFIPTALVGLLFHKIIKTVFFQSEFLIICSILAIGIAFIIIEFLVKKKKLILYESIRNLSLQTAFFIGIFQTMAIIPGVSRAGAVMIGMMLLGYTRRDAALYSFLLAVPTIFGASVLDLIKIDFSILLNSTVLLNLIIGTTISFMTALIVIKLFISFLQKKTLLPFGVYRIILAIFLFLSS